MSTCVDQTHSMLARTQNAFQHVLTKSLPCQRGNKMNLNMWWPNLSKASYYTKCTSTCVDRTHSMLARTQNASQQVLTKPHICQREHKINLNSCPMTVRTQKYLNICLPNPVHASEDTSTISTCVDESHPMPARPQNVSQLVLTKPISCQRGHKLKLNVYWPRTELINASHHVLTKSLPF